MPKRIAIHNYMTGAKSSCNISFIMNDIESLAKLCDEADKAGTEWVSLVAGGYIGYLHGWPSDTGKWVQLTRFDNTPMFLVNRNNLEEVVRMLDSDTVLIPTLSHL
jgi:hypothetical protein